MDCFIVRKRLGEAMGGLLYSVAITLTKGGNLSGFSIQYLHEEGPWGTWNIVLFQVPQLGPPI